MTYTPAQISAAKGGDVFILDYAHADAAQVFSFKAGSWTPYLSSNVTVRDSITPNLDSTGATLAGSITFSVTLLHLDSFASSHLEFDGSDITVEYTIDGGTNWTVVTGSTAFALNPSNHPDLDVRVSFAAGGSGVLNSVTVYVLSDGSITSNSGSRALTFGHDLITDTGLVSSGETISPASDAIDIGSIEIMTVLGQLNSTILNGSVFSFRTDAAGVVVATGCTVYVNGTVSTSVPDLVVSSRPYHFVVVPNAPVNEVFTIGAGLTISHLALYQAVLTSSDALTLFTSEVNGMPTITINDSSVITVTERDPATEFFAYAWSIVSSGSQ